MSELNSLVNSIVTFDKWTHADKIRFFAWYCHSKLGRDRFMPADVKRLYDELALESASNISQFLAQMCQQKPRQVLKDSKGYYLERKVREQFERKHGTRQITVEIQDLLAKLPEQVPDILERDFLQEALSCFRCGAFRASIVMCWNLAFDHLCRFVVHKHLVDFNNAWVTRFPNRHKKGHVQIVKIEDFGDYLRESEVIEIAKSGKIVTSNIAKIMTQKLDRRNIAAHPSTVTITQLQAEDFISDLVNNVILKLDL